MPQTALHETQFVLTLLLLFVSIFAVIARRLETPYPIVLVFAGVLLAILPGIPRIALDPDVVFLLVLPPLVYAAAKLTSLRDFAQHLVSIAMLAIGGVAFTVFGVALASAGLLPGFDWRLGFVLGAVVATTDAIAATSIAKRIGLPKRVVDLLEGEGLVNDATGLLALEFAIAMVVEGRHPSVGSGLLRFAYLSGGAIVAGLMLGRAAAWFGRKIDNGPIQSAFSLLTPYAAWLAAEGIHASGVLAVVTAGLYLGRKNSEIFSPSIRIQGRAIWDSITFILNGFVFILIGLQLPSILAGVSDWSSLRLIVYGILFSAFLIVLRLVWTFPGAWLSHLIQTLVFRRVESRPDQREVFVIGWTGMRGVISLAAAISLPETLSTGVPFPQRDLIIFLAFCSILVTLVLQGLTLPALIRRLGLVGSGGEESEDQHGRRVVIGAGLERLQALRQADRTGFDEVYDDLARHYDHRLASLETNEANAGSPADLYERHLNVSRALVEAEHGAALRLRNEGRISDELLHEIEHELDLNAQRLLAASRK